MSLALGLGWGLQPLWLAAVLCLSFPFLHRRRRSGSWARLGFAELKFLVKGESTEVKTPAPGYAAPTHGAKDVAWGVSTLGPISLRACKASAQEREEAARRGDGRCTACQRRCGHHGTPKGPDPMCHAVLLAPRHTGRLASLSPPARVLLLFFFFPFPSSFFFFFFSFICFSNNVTHPERDVCAHHSRCLSALFP